MCSAYPRSQLPLERSWDFREWGLTAAAYEEIHRLAVTEHRLLRELPVIDDAADALWRLSDSGVWIRIITHRLYVNWGHAIAVSDTVTWLDEARIPYRDICFLGAKPEVEADLYIDDGPHNVEALLAGGNEVIVFDQPYNRHVAGQTRDHMARDRRVRVRERGATRGRARSPIAGVRLGRRSAAAQAIGRTRRAYASRGRGGQRSWGSTVRFCNRT